MSGSLHELLRELVGGMSTESAACDAKCGDAKCGEKAGTIRSSWLYAKGMAMSGVMLGSYARGAVIVPLIKWYGAELGSETEFDCFPRTSAMDIMSRVMSVLSAQQKAGVPYSTVCEVQKLVTKMVDRVECGGMVRVTMMEDIVVPLVRVADAASRVTATDGRVTARDVDQCKDVVRIYRALAEAIVGAFEETVNDVLARSDAANAAAAKDSKDGKDCAGAAAAAANDGKDGAGVKDAKDAKDGAAAAGNAAAGNAAAGKDAVHDSASKL